MGNPNDQVPDDEGDVSQGRLSDEAGGASDDPAPVDDLDEVSELSHPDVDEVAGRLRLELADLQVELDEAARTGDDARQAVVAEAIGWRTMAAAALEDRHAVVGDATNGSTEPLDDDPASVSRPPGPAADLGFDPSADEADAVRARPPVIGALPHRADAGVPADELRPGHRAGTAP